MRNKLQTLIGDCLDQTKMGAMSSLLERPGGRRIFVSTNCVTPLLATALRAIFPDDEIDSLHQLSGAEDAPVIQGFAERLSAADIWVKYLDAKPLTNHAFIAPLMPGITTIDIPHVNFHAFHPDLFLAFRNSGERVTPHYNSGIVVWAYQHRIDPADARRFFNGATFSALGYFSCWDASVRAMRSQFQACNLDFERFFLCVKRMGAFMYSINHPKAETLVALAKLITLKLGAPDRVWERAIDITDHLADFYQWPIYPEIGRYFSLPGFYDWVIQGRHYGLNDFIEAAYGNYAREGILPEEIELDAALEIRANFDRVLENQS